jgi:hypothetical protein
VLFKDEKKNNDIDLGLGLTLGFVGGQGKQAKKMIPYRQGVNVSTLDYSAELNSPIPA